jgi:putative transposase
MEVAMPWRASVFASDTTDAERALLEPFMPAAAGIGRPRTTCLREIANAI